MRTLIVGEHAEGRLIESTLRAVNAARELGLPADLFLAADSEAPAVAEAVKVEGIDKVVCATSAHGQGGGAAEQIADGLLELRDVYSVFLAPATANGKNVLPRLAALLDVMQISEVSRIVGPDEFERYTYAGNAIEVVRSMDPFKVVTIRTSAFAPAVTGGRTAGVEARQISSGRTVPTIKREVRRANTATAELATAKIIVSGGRALGSSENFKTYIEPVASKLGAAIGASRAAVDAGLAPNEWQVGQTGKIVAPEIYMAVGISGAIQHLAGMKDSKVIVAINNDPEAPIFKVADYGLVGDLFEELPKLMQALSSSD